MKKAIFSVGLMILVLSLGHAPEVVAVSLKNLRTQLDPTKDEFAIRESGYWTCEGVLANCVYWLDNDRIIFNGAKPGDTEVTPDGRHVSKHALYIWDLQTRNVSRYAEATKASLCFVDGHLRYSRVEGDDVVVIAGPFGRELEVLRRKRGEKLKSDPANHGWNTELSCHRYRPTPPRPLPGQKIALKEGDGFLYFGPGNTLEAKRESVLFFPDGAKDGIRIGVPRWQLSPPTVARSDVDDSYLLYAPHRKDEMSGIDTCPQEAVERRIYRFISTGSLKTIEIPPDPRLRCYVSRFELVRDGVLVQTGGGHPHNLDLSRLYLLRASQLVEVVRGVISSRRVSPDGCRLAVGISSNGDKRKPRVALYAGHLKVIDLCSSGDR